MDKDCKFITTIKHSYAISVNFQSNHAISTFEKLLILRSSSLLNALRLKKKFKDENKQYDSANQGNCIRGIHKRRLLRGGGRGSPLKADLLHKPMQ